MGNVAASAKRTCRSLFAFSTSTSLAKGEEDEQKITPEQVAELERTVAEQREREQKLLEEIKKRDTHDKVTGKVSFELQELRKTIEQLSQDLTAPGGELAPASDDHKKPYTKLDDYVHETMYALLIWLATKPEFEMLSMGQLMFFLKSPHIKQRKKYILNVERILRTIGLSIFEKDQKVNPRELSQAFNIVEKKITQSKELKRLYEIENRSTWHALE